MAEMTASFSPLPEGSLARLAFPWVPSELAACREHRFRVQAPEVTWGWESDTGYVQRAECLICGRKSRRMDASWWAPVTGLPMVSLD